MPLSYLGRLSAVAAVTAALTALTAGCSGSGAASQAGAGNGGQAANAAQGQAASGGAASNPIARDKKLCQAVKTSDAQALIKPKLGPAQFGGPIGCAFLLPGQQINGDNLTVLIEAGDSDGSNYAQLTAGQGALVPKSEPLAGVGDRALWGQVLWAPVIVAHKGDVTCSVALPSDASQTTLPYTGVGVDPTVTKADAQAFAQKMGVLCNDVFAAD